MSINKEVWKARIKLAVIILLSIVIGATATYSYIEGKNLYNHIVIGKAYAYHTNASPAPASDDAVNDLDKSDGVTASALTPYDIIQKYDWDKKVAYAVARAESNLISTAYNQNTNGTWDAGIFQINSIHGFSRQDMEDPEKNIEAAYQIYLKAGRSFQPWVVYNRGFYLNEL